MPAVLDAPPLEDVGRSALPEFDQTDRRAVTAEEFLQLPDCKEYELVRGELVRREMGWESEFFGTRLIVLLGYHCMQTRCGEVNGSNGSYQCFDSLYPDTPDHIRKPDVSFIAAGRLPKSGYPKGHCRIAPDLCVEVLSPNDRASEVEEKIDEYLAVGVRLVWIVDPHTKTIRIVRKSGVHSILHLNDELSGEDVIPGFVCEVKTIFEVPTEPLNSNSAGAAEK